MKTNELTGAALDWAVAKCEPDDTVQIYFDEDTGEKLCYDDWDIPEFNPSTDWAQGGPIIEREGISLETWHGAWKAELEFLPDDDTHYRYGQGAGPTPLIAAMRCYVASKLGDDVDLPKELT